MNDSREILIGYLCGALDEDESRKVQQKLNRSESLQLELAALRKEMRPLEEYAQWMERACEPPQGLARRTCRQIWDQVDGGQQMADDGLDHSKPRADRKKTRQGEWKFSEVAPTICIGILVLFLVVPAFYWVRNQVVHIVRQKTMKKIANNTAALSQIHEESLLLGKGENLIVTNMGGSDLGTLLASFGETNLSQKTLNFFPPGEVNVGKYSLIPQTSVSILVGHFPVGSLSQFPPQYTLPLPQVSELFDPQAVASTQCSEKIPGLIFIEWEGVSIPIFVEVGEGRTSGALINVSNEQNLIYRDGRVFFRKPGL